jgi:hypothetical protein
MLAELRQRSVSGGGRVADVAAMAWRREANDDMILYVPVATHEH